MTSTISRGAKEQIPWQNTSSPLQLQISRLSPRYPASSASSSDFTWFPPTKKPSSTVDIPLWSVAYIISSARKSHRPSSPLQQLPESGSHCINWYSGAAVGAGGLGSRVSGRRSSIPSVTLCPRLFAVSGNFFHGSNHQIKKLEIARTTTKRKIRGQVQQDFFSSLLLRRLISAIGIKLRYQLVVLVSP